MCNGVKKFAFVTLGQVTELRDGLITEIRKFGEQILEGEFVLFYSPGNGLLKLFGKVVQVLVILKDKCRVPYQKIFSEKMFYLAFCLKVIAPGNQENMSGIHRSILKIAPFLQRKSIQLILLYQSKQ